MKILHVVGARPNFMKVAPIMVAMAKQPEHFEQVLVHTGQHYDENMSKVFFRDLELPEPDVYLGVGSGSHAQQTARVMQLFEPVVLEHKPDWVIVVGDVNSTLACALVCAKLGIKVAHVEAGLRSFDRTMPEEINRLLTDQLADLLFTTEESANQNLRREGIAPEKIHFVGNVMIDSLVRYLPLAQNSNVLQELDLSPAQYAVVTLHRPANVDNPDILSEIFAALLDLAQQMPVVFPVHPRTRKALEAMGNPKSEISMTPEAKQRGQNLKLIEPLGYLDFLQLYSNARLVLTDSGGLQEETTYLGIPCLTLRPNTERPVTIALGTNQLVLVQREAIGQTAQVALNGQRAKGEKPPLWDGRAAEKIAKALVI